jgi:hypothetical protein
MKWLLTLVALIVLSALPADFVLLNPESGNPLSSRRQLYQHCLALGRLAGVSRATPHCFRDTFACDMLTRGIGIYQVAMMLADTVDTVQKHYAEFIPAARDAVQLQMVNGIGIEERAELAQKRGKKVVGIREKLLGTTVRQATFSEGPTTSNSKQDTYGGRACKPDSVRHAGVSAFVPRRSFL